MWEGEVSSGINWKILRGKKTSQEMKTGVANYM